MTFVMKYHTLQVNGERIIFRYSWKLHHWKVYRDQIQGEPLMSFTKAKGDAVIDFLEQLLERRNEE